MKKEITLEKAKTYIKNVVESIENCYDEFEIQFMGGEPLLEFELIKNLSEWLWNEKWSVSLSHIFAATNGTLLDDEKKEWFLLNKNRICLGLSFDGNRLMQDRNRSNSFNEIDLNFFLTTWPNQTVKMTISPDTVDSLYDGVLFLNSFGFKSVTADFAMGQKVVWERKHLERFRIQLQALADYYVDHPECACVSLLDLDVTSVLNSQERRLKHCGCGEQFTCIDCDGTIYACHLFSPVSASNEQAKNSLSIDFSDHTQFTSKQCTDCLLLNVCNRCCGMSYLSFGNIYEPIPFSCTVFRLQFAIACEMHLRIAINAHDLERVDKIQKVIECLKE